MTSRARLLKVLVQPVFVMDDGDTIEEATGQPITVTARDWPTFTTSAFGEAELATIAAQWDAQHATQTPPGSPERG